MERKREIWVDWMRVAACFMVMLVHCTEPFYLGGEGSLILTRSDAFWASFFDSFVRACVPLFVVASSYLQFPVHYSTGEFFKRRAKRILIPFAIWSVVYALAWGEPVQNFKDLLLNFNYAAGHLWFVYMIVGLYLIMPLLSPWAEKVGRKELLVYIFLCFLTTFIPYVREFASGGDVPVIYGPSGIPNPAKYPLWGEASWNTFGLFYYLSGFLGYMLLGLYLRKFVAELGWGRTLAVALPSWIAGFALCFGGFLKRVFASCGGVFPIEGPTGMAAQWETPWFNDSAGVFLMTLGWILLLRKINSDGGFYKKILLPISKASYGMYLCHLLILSYISAFFRGLWGIGDAGVMGIWTTPVQIVLSTLCTFICTAAASILLQRIPKIGKYIIG
ncbi:MAG: acyltransferase [Bacteroidales bacterium]|nr:acyltransferase [Bacteroidales bacterium]